jgi:hypothetical protein
MINAGEVSARSALWKSKIVWMFKGPLTRNILQLSRVPGAVTIWMFWFGMVGGL